jgi:hypothetical protein
MHSFASMKSCEVARLFERMADAVSASADRSLREWMEETDEIETRTPRHRDGVAVRCFDCERSVAVPA